MYLHQIRLHLDHMLPAIIPQIVPPPQPVLVPLGQVGVEPRRHGHHVRLPAERRDPGLVAGGGHVLRADGPGIPAEEAVDEVECRHQPGRSQTGPAGDERDAGGLDDLAPVVDIARAFERRHERLALEAELGGRVLVGVYFGNHAVHGPGTLGLIVEGEEELEVTDGLGGRIGVLQDAVGVGVFGGDVEREAVDVGVLGLLDVGLPLLGGHVCSIADLDRSDWFYQRETGFLR